MFVDADNGNYYLQTGSPCLSSANCEGAPDVDKDRRTRPLGSGCDMGAYEQLDDGSITKSNPWDVNNDGTVDISDLVMVGNSFGEHADNLAADVNNDGKVDISDLALVGIHFGEEIAAKMVIVK